MITFSKEIKEEICHTNYSDETKKFILYSFFKNTYILENKFWIIKTKSATTARFILSIIQNFFCIESKLIEAKSNNTKNHLYKLIIKINNSQINDLFFLNKKLITNKSNNEEKKGYLIGAFLSKGSINNPNNSNYHFEIKIINNILCNEIVLILKKMKMNYKILEKEKHKIIYIKKSEQISDLLKFMDTYNCMVEYEDKRICRDYSNQIYRLNNLDVSNLKKIVDNSNKQIHWIKEIKKNHSSFNKLSNNEKLYCDLRIKYESVSLNEIVALFKKEYNILLTKSALNHYSRKIKEIYLNEIEINKN